MEYTGNSHRDEQQLWASEEAYQKFFYGERYMEADTTNPRLDKPMKLFGGRGFYVERAEELPYPARAADVFKDKTPTFKDRA